jgi:glucose-1-phosphate adenylyltransferase
MDFLEYGDEEYAVMIDSAILSNFDLEKIVAAHAASGKDITVVTKRGVCNGEKLIDLALKLNENGEPVDMAVDYAAGEEYAASMDIFVLNKKWLMAQVKECVARNEYHMDRDLVLGGWRAGRVSVNVFEYDGVAQYNESELEYYNHTLALLNKEVRADLFGRCHPVYTKVRDRVPCYYGEDSEIENCLIADGCMLEGEVEDSVLFRQVTIAPGAKVENCIVMNDCVIGEGAKLKYVILDKDVTVTPGANVCGTKEHPVVIKKGQTV